MIEQQIISKSKMNGDTVLTQKEIAHFDLPFFTRLLAIIHAIMAKTKCQYIGEESLFLGRPKIINKGVLRIENKVMLNSQIQQCRIVVGAKAQLIIGAGTWLNSTIISANKKISIGRNCQFGPFCHLMDSDFHDLHDRSKPGPAADIIIEDNVKIGARTLILKGVVIGAESTVLPGAVVTKSIPGGSVAGGVPAKVISS